MAKQYMIDLRCPKCNANVMKNPDSDVVYRSRLPKVSACPRCKCPLKLVENKEDDRLNQNVRELTGNWPWYFDVAKVAVRK